MRRGSHCGIVSDLSYLRSRARTCLDRFSQYTTSTCLTATLYLSIHLYVKVPLILSFKASAVFSHKVHYAARSGPESISFIMASLRMFWFLLIDLHPTQYSQSNELRSVVTYPSKPGTPDPAKLKSLA